MSLALFAVDGGLEPSFLEAAFARRRELLISDLDGQSFPLADFLRTFWKNLSPDDLKTGYAWQMLVGLEPRNKLTGILTAWEASLGSNEREGLLRAFPQEEEYNTCSPEMSKLLRTEHPAADRLRREFQAAVVPGPAGEGPGTRWTSLRQQLTDLLPLEPADADLAGLAYALTQVEALDAFFNAWGRQKVMVACRMLGLSLRQFYTRTAEAAPLSALEVIYSSSDRFLHLAEVWVTAFHTLSFELKVRENLRSDPGLSLPLESFSVPEIETSLLVRLLSAPGPANLLLAGAPGTGKSELARSLILAAGREPWTLGGTLGGGAIPSLSDLVMARKVLGPGAAVLVIDEAETFLGALGIGGGAELDQDQKARVNLLLDASETKTVWIVNHLSCLDASTLRRFHHIYQMPKPSRQRRQALWARCGEANGFRGEAWEPLWTEAAGRYEVVPSVISQTLRTVALVSGNLEPNRVGREIHTLVKAQAQVGNGRVLVPEPRGLWSLDSLNLSADPAALVEGLRAWSLRDPETRGGQRLLFHGEPGTGKTELARQAARLLDRELHVHRASDLQSPWVGVAEKNIRRAFETAEEEGALMLIDEMDSFLYRRSQAQRSWELSQVNEFLTGLETYRGLFIGTTNGLDRLDPAVLRRFHQKIEFRYLEPSQAAVLAGRYFPDLAAPDGFLWASMPPLAPGDFAAVAGHARQPSTWSGLVEALKAEAGYRNPSPRRVGFGPSEDSGSGPARSG